MEEVRAITVHSQSNIDAPGFVVTPTGLVVNGQPTFDEWEQCGKALQLADEAIQWARGDHLNYGESTWGEMYSQYLDDGLSYTTLAHYKWVSKEVQFCRRRQNLSWSHHEEVASLKVPEQDMWLDRAEQGNDGTPWKRQRLRDEIRKWKQERDRPQAHQLTARGPRLIVAQAEDMPQVASESVDLIVTSPPYNMGDDYWPMGGEGRIERGDGIGYGDHMAEGDYQLWQLDCLQELYRVAKQGASLFYNHKVRIRQGEMIHPLDWLRVGTNPWTLRQEIIWDRGSTHNHSASLFWPHDERIYWMTKGRPTLPSRPIGLSTIWAFHGPVAGTWHPAPFADQLPRCCIEAVGRDGIVVLDPFAGSCTTLKAALSYGYDAIGVDVSREYLTRAAEENGWMMPSGN